MFFSDKAILSSPSHVISTGGAGMAQTLFFAGSALTSAQVRGCPATICKNWRN